MLGDLVAVALLNGTSEKVGVYALDFSENPEIISEGMQVSLVGAGRTAIESLKPAIASTSVPTEFPPELHPRMGYLSEPKTVCHIPLVSRARALGLLAVGRTVKHPYDPDEIEFLTHVAGQIAIAIENALAYEEITRLKDRLSEEKHYLEEEIRSEMGFEQSSGTARH